MLPKPVQQAFHRYPAAAGGRAEQPLSALNWKQQQTEFQQLPDQAWLLYVVHAVQMLQRSKNQPDQKFIIQRHTAAPDFERSGSHCDYRYYGVWASSSFVTRDAAFYQKVSKVTSYLTLQIMLCLRLRIWLSLVSPSQQRNAGIASTTPPWRFRLFLDKTAR